MGSAWREVGKKHAFDKVLKMVEEVNSMGMEVCCTLGMLTEEQAKKLKDAGLTAYNHNLDTSREYYGKVRVTTRAPRQLAPEPYSNLSAAASLL